MLSAGTKFEKGIGSGRERKAEERIMVRPQKMWEIRLFVIGCLNAEILDVKLLNLQAALKMNSNFS